MNLKILALPKKILDEMELSERQFGLKDRQLLIMRVRQYLHITGPIFFLFRMSFISILTTLKLSFMGI